MFYTERDLAIVRKVYEERLKDEYSNEDDFINWAFRMLDSYGYEMEHIADAIIALGIEVLYL